MSLLLISILLALMVLAYVVGQRTALRVSSGDPRSLHSRPTYHGYYVALWCGLPALALLLVFSLSLRLRAKEIETNAMLGCNRSTTGRLLAAEVAVIGCASLALCALLAVSANTARSSSMVSSGPVVCSVCGWRPRPSNTANILSPPPSSAPPHRETA